MIKDFLIINFTGKNDSIGLRVNNNFFVKKLQTNIRKNNLLVNNIFEFTKQKNANIDKNFSIIVNIGPGSFSGIRISLIDRPTWISLYLVSNLANMCLKIFIPRIILRLLDYLLYQ